GLWNVGFSGLCDEGWRAGLGEFYRRVEAGSSLGWFIPLGRLGHWSLRLSPDVSWRSAHPASEDRFDADAFASVAWSPNRFVAVEPFLELGYSFYPNDSSTLIDRRDLHVRCGASLAWRIGGHAFASLSGYWLGNYSSATGADYQVVPSKAA